MGSSNQQSDSLAQEAGQFGHTHWSIVLAAGRSESTHAQVALEQLCANYWHPIYFYVRRQGHSPADAQDLTQEFFARLLARNDIATVDPSKGRFRSFLLASLKLPLSSISAEHLQFAPSVVPLVHTRLLKSGSRQPGR